MSNVVLKGIIDLADKELEAANERFGLNHSDHESFAVLREEMDEIAEEMKMLEEWAKRIWENVKSDAAPEIIRKNYEKAYATAIHLATEAVQAAAMARKGVISNIEFEKKEASCTTSNT